VLSFVEIPPLLEESASHGKGKGANGDDARIGDSVLPPTVGGGNQKC